MVIFFFSHVEWTIHDLASNMQGEGQTDVLIMDFAKAFDKVGYRRLIHTQGFQKAQYWVLASSYCTYSPVHVKDLAESLSTRVRLLVTLYYTWLFSEWFCEPTGRSTRIIVIFMETLYNPYNLEESPLYTM